MSLWNGTKRTLTLICVSLQDERMKIKNGRLFPMLRGLLL